MDNFYLYLLIMFLAGAVAWLLLVGIHRESDTGYWCADKEFGYVWCEGGV